MSIPTKRTYAVRNGKIVEITGEVKGWYSFEVLGFPGNCPFKHDNIDILYGVSPTTRDRLPRICGCGQMLTYAEKVVFCDDPQMAVVGTKED